MSIIKIDSDIYIQIKKKIFKFYINLNLIMILNKNLLFLSIYNKIE